MTEKKQTEEFIEVIPAADIMEDNNGVELILEVPGAGSEHVNVEVEGRVLQISAASSLHRQGHPVIYKRAFQLSDGVDVQRITAKTKDGLLTLTLPKSEKAKVHKIKVE